MSNIDSKPAAEARYCWSTDGEAYRGDAPTREEALAEATAALGLLEEPGETRTAWTGVQRDAFHFLRKQERSVGERLVEQLDEWLLDDIASEDPIISLDTDRCAELGKVVLDFLQAHASLGAWGVGDVQEHQVIVPTPD